MFHTVGYNAWLLLAAIAIFVGALIAGLSHVVDIDLVNVFFWLP